MEYLTRSDVLADATEKCIKALYEQAQPKVEWEDFIRQNKEYKEGPRPYEFYYLPEKIFKEIVEMYQHAYKVPSQIKNHINTLTNYFNDPIRDKWIKGKTEDEPGHRGYEHFIPLKEIIGEDNLNKVLEYMNEALNFYRWDYDLQCFNMSVYLGASPNSNKQAVIDNWKKYRGIDIIIDESIYEEYDD